MAASQPKVNLCDPATVLFVVAPSLFDVNKKQCPYETVDPFSFPCLPRSGQSFGCH